MGSIFSSASFTTLRLRSIASFTFATWPLSVAISSSRFLRALPRAPRSMVEARSALTQSLSAMVVVI